MLSYGALIVRQTGRAPLSQSGQVVRYSIRLRRSKAALHHRIGGRLRNRLVEWRNASGYFPWCGSERAHWPIGRVLTGLRACP